MSNNDDVDVSTTESDPCSVDADTDKIDTPVLIEDGKQGVKTKKVVEKKALKKKKTCCSRCRRSALLCVFFVILTGSGMAVLFLYRRWIASGKQFPFFGIKRETMEPTPIASLNPSITISEFPSSFPTTYPSEFESSIPSTIPTTTPSFNPSISSSLIPSVKPTGLPSGTPSTLPSSSPSIALSAIPSSSPSISPSSAPSSSPSSAVFDFYVFGDIPYRREEHEKMLYYVESIPSDGHFLMHVGDINKATRGCPETPYIISHNILRSSEIPIFITPGDNEWNDCPDPDLAWEYYMKYFESFDKYWDHSLPVKYQSNRTENFSMYMEGFQTLFIGLNLVGGMVHDETEWETRLQSQFEWTLELIEENRETMKLMVLFGHCNPRSIHFTYFKQFLEYAEDNLQDISILYIHGDGHEYEVEDAYKDVPNFTRIQVDMGDVAPPIRVRLDKGSDVPFQIDRRFEASFNRRT